MAYKDMYVKPDTKTCTLNQIQRTTRTFRELMTEQFKPSKRARTHAVLVIGLYELLGNPTT
jgi:hypothetical protein